MSSTEWHHVATNGQADAGSDYPISALLIAQREQRYYLKGGAAMELPFAQHARATKDLDLGIEGSRASRKQTLSRCPAFGLRSPHISTQRPDSSPIRAVTIKRDAALSWPAGGPWGAPVLDVPQTDGDPDGRTRAEAEGAIATSIEGFVLDRMKKINCVNRGQSFRIRSGRRFGKWGCCAPSLSFERIVQQRLLQSGEPDVASGRREFLCRAASGRVPAGLQTEAFFVWWPNRPRRARRMIVGSRKRPAIPTV